MSKSPTLFNQILEQNVSLKDDDEIRDKLHQMIEYAIDRHDWYENQRNRFATVALTMLGFAGALMIGMGDPAKYNLTFRVFGTAFVVSIVVTSLVVLREYMKVSEASHPYRKLADIRSWYFRYVASNNFADDLNSLSNEETKRAELKKLGETLRDFVIKWQEYSSNKSGFVKEDLQQVFILYLLQNYRQRNLKVMLRELKSGTFISGILLIVTALANILG